MSEELTFKWGSLKGWDVGNNAEARAALRRWIDGGVSMSAMSQHDTPEQKKALCDLIDAIDGRIINDWEGAEMTKDEAKKYVLEYGQ